MLTWAPPSPPLPVIFRGPHDKYEERKPDDWQALPVVSVAPMRWPKLQANGTKYSFGDEREMAKNKVRAALTICAYNDIRSIVIGDFGLGNSYRNPPQEMAELWREVFLWDTNLRGRIENVAFVFEDATQSTTRLILEDAAKKSKGGSSSGGGGGSSSSSKGKGKVKPSGSSSSSSSSSGALGAPTDVEIFQRFFDAAEIHRVASQGDPRMGLGNLMS